MENRHFTITKERFLKILIEAYDIGNSLRINTLKGMINFLEEQLIT